MYIDAATGGFIGIIQNKRRRRVERMPPGSDLGVRKNGGAQPKIT